MQGFLPSYAEYGAAAMGTPLQMELIFGKISFVYRQFSITTFDYRKVDDETE